ncbi:MAG: hypothetical protein AB1498_03705 [bacterium]
MNQEPKAMEEIHKIREALYEEEKKLSTEELISKIRKESEAAKKKYKLNFRVPVTAR